MINVYMDERQYTLDYIHSFIRQQQNKKMEKTRSEKQEEDKSSAEKPETVSIRSSEQKTVAHDQIQEKRSGSFKVPRPPEEIPCADKQRQIITSLEGEEESLHVYCVSKEWYEKWKNYVGINESNKCIESDKPGPATMHIDSKEEDSNTFVDEKIWKKWIKWWGIADEHSLDRRNWTSDDKTFEICILNPYSGIVQNPIKTFDISEQTGYIELQLRKIFRVPKHRNTRLWTCEKARSARFHLLLDRTREICFQDQVDQKREYILALEIAGLDSTWPTHVPGEPRGGFERYDQVTQGPKPVEYWEAELATAVETVFNGIGAELQETVSGIVTTSKCITANKEKELTKARDKIEHKLKHISDTQTKFESKVREISHQEEIIKDEVKRTKKEREKLDNERKKFEDELKRMEDLNKIHEARIRLDIGGHMYMTSTLTLTKDPNSMLAAMFSGRHALNTESDGSYFIDRDGTHFRYILNYLRDGGFRDGTLPTDKGILTELLTEAEYYQISGLSKLLSNMINKPDDDDDDDANPIRPSPVAGVRKPSRKIALRK